MNDWPVPTALERLIYTLIGLSSWSWAALTALWLLLFHPFPREEWKREGNTWRRVGSDTDDR